MSAGPPVFDKPSRSAHSDPRDKPSLFVAAPPRATTQDKAASIQRRFRQAAASAPTACHYPDVSTPGQPTARTNGVPLLPTIRPCIFASPFRQPGPKPQLSSPTPRLNACCPRRPPPIRQPVACRNRPTTRYRTRPTTMHRGPTAPPIMSPDMPARQCTRLRASEPSAPADLAALHTTCRLPTLTPPKPIPTTPRSPSRSTTPAGTCPAQTTPTDAPIGPTANDPANRPSTPPGHATTPGRRRPLCRHAIQGPLYPTDRPRPPYPRRVTVPPGVYAPQVTSPPRSSRATTPRLTDHPLPTCHIRAFIAAPDPPSLCLPATRQARTTPQRSNPTSQHDPATAQPDYPNPPRPSGIDPPAAESPRPDNPSRPGAAPGEPYDVEPHPDPVDTSDPVNACPALRSCPARQS